MPKIHLKMSNNCMICNEECVESKIMFHKTNRQTHSLCMDCGIGYMKPLLNQITNNIRKNIRKGVTTICCPGTYHSLSRNRCKHRLSLLYMEIPECELSLDVFRIKYVLSSPNILLCPDSNCGQIVEVEDMSTDDIICNTKGCNTSWCKSCLAQPYHKGKNCLEYNLENSKTENGKYLLDMYTKGLMKYCKLCKTPTIKQDGCNKMLCSVCGGTWCWLCGNVGIDYQHYNTNNFGSCTGRLWEGVDEYGNDIV